MPDIQAGDVEITKEEAKMKKKVFGDFPLYCPNCYRDGWEGWVYE